MSAGGAVFDVARIVAKHGSHDQKAHGRRGTAAGDNRALLGKAPTNETEAATMFQMGIVGTDGRTYRTEVVDFSSEYEGESTVFGRIVADDGTVIGDFSRSFSQDRDGNTLVEHDRLNIVDEYQRRGIGGQFVDESMRQYAAAGITKVLVSTADDGNIVWAKKGFGWSEGTQGHVPPRVMHVLARKHPDQVHPELAEAALKMPPYNPTFFDVHRKHLRADTPQQILEKFPDVLADPKASWSGELAVDPAWALRKASSVPATITVWWVGADADPDDPDLPKEPRNRVAKHGSHDQKSHGRRGAATGVGPNGDGGDSPVSSGGPGSLEARTDAVGRAAPSASMDEYEFNEQVIAEGLVDVMTMMDGDYVDVNDKYVRGAAKERAKQALADTVMAKLADNPELQKWLEDEQVTSARKFVEHHAQQMLDCWAASSSDHNPKSLVMQKLAAEMFGRDTGGIDDLLADVPGRSRYDLEQAQRDAPVLKALLEASYENTQKALADAGITEVTVARGMRWDSSTKTVEPEGWDFNNDDPRLLGVEFQPAREKAPAAIYDMANSAVTSSATPGSNGFREGLGEVPVGSNPMSSWSVDATTADQFAGSHQKDRVNVTLSMTVPASRVLSIPKTGPGCLNEYEVVLIAPPKGKSDTVTAHATGAWSERPGERDGDRPPGGATQEELAMDWTGWGDLAPAGVPS